MSQDSPRGPTVARDPALDEAVLVLGEEVFRRMKGETPGVFNKDYWQGRIMEWAMKDPSFKVDMFRFVDVLPVLRDKEQIGQHIKEYLLKEGRELPTVISAALKAASGGLTAGLGASMIKKNVTEMAERFIVGTDAKTALPVLKKLHKSGIAFTVDLLGEATVSENEADAYQRRYLDLIDNLATETKDWAEDEVIDRNHLGPIPRVNVSLKASAMASRLDAADPAGSVARLKERILPLFVRAKERGVFLNVDLEQWAVHDITYSLFEEILAEPGLRDWPHVGIVVQAYLRSAHRDVDRLLSLAKGRGAPITVRLVKGAYWDYETVIAQQNGWEIPVFQDKAATDANYESLSRKLLENTDHLLPAFGSHNLRSVTHSLVLAKELKVPERAFEIQMLYGMAEPERRVFRSLGHRVRVYAPVGELLPGMAYLVRRLLENTSNSGFLKLSYHDGVDQKKLLQAPIPAESATATTTSASLETPFDNCPLADFTDGDVVAAYQRADATVRASFPIGGADGIRPMVSGQPSAGASVFARSCPSDLRITVATVRGATVQESTAALEAATAAFPAWRDRPLRERALLLERAADLMTAEREELAVLMSYEVGKGWRSADADVAEAIDFCRYYARQALVELGPKKQGAVPGEENLLFYEGRGPTVVIAPWNFPLAILAGMTVAALVAGNPVIMKPAEQSSAIAWKLYELLRRAGVPGDVVHFLPGIGEEIGPALVNHVNTAQIAFTGSRAVGLSILEAAAKTQPGQREVKRVVCEMGGKNAIIVDEDADIDEAVLGVVESAFGFAGQKCSAASRVLVVGDAYDAFVERLVDAVRSLPVGAAHDPTYAMGPVVDEVAQRRLLDVIEKSSAGATLLYQGPTIPGGYFVAPAIFAVESSSHPLMQDELFGPVLAVWRAPSFSEALAVANDVEYALTGAVFSRSPRALDEARASFKVGNLYLNRGSTGALVDRQPFGGFRMSGGGTKAGGPGYLLNFANPRVVTENTMRRGFTPDLPS